MNLCVDFKVFQFNSTVKKKIVEFSLNFEFFMKIILFNYVFFEFFKYFPLTHDPTQTILFVDMLVGLSLTKRNVGF